MLLASDKTQCWVDLSENNETYISEDKTSDFPCLGQCFLLRFRCY